MRSATWRDDPRRGRFFAYLNLFVFFMLMLVLGANYLVLYLGWEGVGLCSFLLIGFWFDKVANAEAAKKAFITTRIGDTLMLVGLATLVFKFGTLDFEPIFGTAASVLTKDGATVIALLLFAGAIGKSAQLPLQVWLPDAMAGPTPVSALIHAATMVTAGVYLVIRSHVLFEVSGVALTVVLVIGVATALFAATCAIAQFDIKRVLAYSTISQLGYMFIAVGMRAYAVAMFFLVAHAFYKALMFLGAGSVIHGMHDDQDMRQMGGLRKAMPITFVTFLVGALAQAGIPPLAGFFAKDALLEVAQHSGRTVVYALGTLAAFLTAFYLGRMLIMTFFGTPRSEKAEHAHESSPLLWIPLAILAAGVAFAGVLELSPDGRLAAYLEPVTGAAERGERADVRRAGGDRGRRRDRVAGDRLVDLRVGPDRPDRLPRAAGADGHRGTARLVRRSGLRRRVRPAGEGARADDRRRRGREGHRRRRQRGRRTGETGRSRRQAAPDGVRAHLRAGVVPGRGAGARLHRGAGMSGHLLSVVIFLPLLGVLGLVLGGRQVSDAGARWIALLVTLVDVRGLARGARPVRDRRRRLPAGRAGLVGAGRSGCSTSWGSTASACGSCC